MFLDRMNPILQRVIVSTIGCIILALVLSLSMHPIYSIMFLAVQVLIIGMAISEFYHISQIKGYRPKERLGQFINFSYVTAVFFLVWTPYVLLLPLALVIYALLLTFVSYIAFEDDPFDNIPLTLFAIFYLTIPLSCTIQINYLFSGQDMQDGRLWLLYLLFITYITDGSALFWGRLLGNIKFAPYISPKKTWEGAIGGFITAIVVSVVFQMYTSIEMSLSESIVLGASISILAQLGDLAESLLKRAAKIKDSSHIPGLGGMLDILDSLVFTAPFLYLYLRVFA